MIFKRSVPKVLSLTKRFVSASEVCVLDTKLICGIKDKDLFAESPQLRGNFNIYLYSSWVRSLLVSFPFRLLLLFQVSLDCQRHSRQHQQRVFTTAAVTIIDFFVQQQNQNKKEDFYQASEMQS